ncbi:MAG: cbb3-type cytochrome c oxidase subunit 3 [Rhodospirillaceae bacterium]|jgi:cytochrome c oxidase cbb3-type subunit IV|nr:cbb3-type cytochrome c oxidase subunit 3 [Rhodospirillaceae bacterium]MBT5456310.1 cbb3-type cytochrome c oxidase subunit 3 [Rhodospirillaceae bacterium]MBT6912238.1 cbb3-type cytochrome c oxidase subunit 3 [Rhodospirillaceae bacterium]MBT7250821.1 cbb3-type cytochrome c oxidase subunit 3 [Rhodospirillaceae bacterium]
MNYETLAHFAHTWGLVYLVVLFAGVLIYALRPGARAKFEDAAQIPFKED